MLYCTICCTYVHMNIETTTTHASQTLTHAHAYSTTNNTLNLKKHCLRLVSLSVRMSSTARPNWTKFGGGGEEGEEEFPPWAHYEGLRPGSSLLYDGQDPKRATSAVCNLFGYRLGGQPRGDDPVRASTSPCNEQLSMLVIS